jgi:uncharacterized repeat protein (TIGR03803 family)
VFVLEKTAKLAFDRCAKLSHRGAEKMKTVSTVLFAAAVGCAFVQPVAAEQAATFKERVLWSFGHGKDGQGPAAGPIDVNGILYGTTLGGGIYGHGTGCQNAGCGTVFSLDPGTGAETVLYSFCSEGKYCLDGASPWGGLIDVKGKLYGMTEIGGANAIEDGSGGTLFSLDTGTGAEKVVYSFCSQQNCADGANPYGSLIDVKGMLYGTADTGGNAGFGTAFAFDPSTGAETVLYSFCSQQHCVDGRNAALGLIDVNGTLYGTTIAGGADYTGCQNVGCGTVFSLDPGTGAETVYHSFAGGADGAVPESSLIDVKGMLYGTTEWGGGAGCFKGYGCGTVYSFDPGTGAVKVLYSFCSQSDCKDGALPVASLIEVKGTLYGTTQSGGNTGCGSYGCGTVFSIDPNTGAEKVIYAFCSQRNCTDGEYPSAGLINVKGSLYGTTSNGGAYGLGTVFVLEKTH